MSSRELKMGAFLREDNTLLNISQFNNKSKKVYGIQFASKQDPAVILNAKTKPCSNEEEKKKRTQFFLFCCTERAHTRGNGTATRQGGAGAASRFRGVLAFLVELHRRFPVAMGC